MSRFHDEFFRNGSPAHDSLMIKCMSEKGIKKIIEELNIENTEVKPFYEIFCKKSSNYRNVTICQCDNFENRKRAFLGTKKECEWRWGCENKKTCGFEIEEPKPYIIEARSITHLSKPNISKETEVIIKNGNFIIGYADGLISVAYYASEDLEVEERQINHRSDSIDFKILIEVKPELTSIGDTIRQIKTYKSLLRNSNIVSVIVTYTTLDEAALEYLKGEGIIAIVWKDN